VRIPCLRCRSIDSRTVKPARCSPTCAPCRPHPRSLRRSEGSCCSCEPTTGRALPVGKRRSVCNRSSHYNCLPIARGLACDRLPSALPAFFDAGDGGAVITHEKLDGHVALLGNEEAVARGKELPRCPIEVLPGEG